MSRYGIGTLATAVITEHKLRAEDEVTRQRLAELVGGDQDAPVARATSDRFGHLTRAPPAATKRARWPRVWSRLTRILARLTGRRIRRTGAVVGVGVGVLMAVVLSGFGLGPGAVLVGTLTAVLALAFVIWRLHGPLQPVPSELDKSAFEPRAQHTPEVLGAPSMGVDPTVEPLLLPRWTTGILSEALAVETFDGRLDVDRLVNALALLQTPSRLPRRQRRSIDSGAQVLVDFSEDMLPFREDVVGLLHRLRRVLGQSDLSVLRFAGRPMTNIGPKQRATWGPYEAPHVRQAVLVITNFGLSLSSQPGDDRDSKQEWASLIDELERLRCPVIALVPNASVRVPELLRRRIAVIQWDRTTTAASVRRALRR
jgi:hypothetical protein